MIPAMPISLSPSLSLVDGILSFFFFLFLSAPHCTVVVVACPRHPNATVGSVVSSLLLLLVYLAAAAVRTKRQQDGDGGGGVAPHWLEPLVPTRR